MPEKTIKIMYTGTQPLVFADIGRVVEYDKAGNVKVKTKGREIRLIPSSALPPAEQHQPVDAATWEAAKKHPLMGATIAHHVKLGQIHEFPG